MLIKATVSVWDARRLDKRVTEETNEAHGAAKEAGRYRKHLLGGPKEAATHAAALAAGAAFREALKGETLPWTDKGVRLLPTANYSRCVDAMRAARRRFLDAVEAFLRDYPAQRDRAKALLNGMYREEDYPTVEELRDRFSCSLDFSPLPARGDFRIDLGAEQVEEIERATEERIRDATAKAVQDAWHRLRTVVAKLKARLSEQKPDGKSPRFHDTLVGNVGDVCDVLGRLNVTDDPALEEIRAKAKAELATLDPETLRKAPAARQAAVKTAGGVLDRLAELYGGGQ